MSELSARLAGIPGLTLSAVYGGFDTDEGWSHFKWTVALAYKGAGFATSYRTGLGHAKPAHGVTVHGDLVDTPKGAMRHEQAARDGYLRPTPPAIADVVYSLVSDASSSEQTFEDWCAEFGYDSDSRKALATYLECQATRTKLLALFGAELLAELTKLEH